MATAENGELFLAQGMDYLSFLEILHRRLEPEWYLEIGTQTGKSLRLSCAASVSVDPNYVLRHEIMQNKPALHCFQETSDAFFEAGRLKQLGARIDLAFLDGMHLFEYLLRDFIGTEKHCAPASVVLLHDCLPYNLEMAQRERVTSSWCGDVWKMVPILQKYRPDLILDVVDAAPTGLVVVSNLDPQNTVLADNYDAILEEYLELGLEEYGIGKYVAQANVQRSEASRWNYDFPHLLGTGWENRPDISIKIAAPTANRMLKWGDYAFASGLARAFSRQGHRVNIRSKQDWYQDTQPGGIDLVLRGRTNFERQNGRRCLIWCISKRMRGINYAHADHVFFASKQLYEEELEGSPLHMASLLPQAFDSDVMAPGRSGLRDGIVFVGRNRAGFMRKSVEYAAATGENFHIWGPEWRDSDYARFVVGDYIESADLSQLYQSAEIVLNDHTPTMLQLGFLSNRVFDTLACGAIPVSEDVGWLPDDIAEFVYLYHDQPSFDAAISAARAETADMRARRDQLAHDIARAHSFDARAREILAVASQLS